MAQLIPPPRKHRHHYHGVLAANSNYRSRVTQFANQAWSASKAKSLVQIKVENETLVATETKPVIQIKKSTRRWAQLIKKVYEVDPLKCEQCGKTLKVIAFIVDVTSIHRILSHIGEESEAPQIHPARGPPNEFYTQECEVAEYQYDQTISW